MSDPLRALGVACDRDLTGATLALLDTDGEHIAAVGANRRVAFSRELIIHLRRAALAAREGRDGAAEIGKAGGETTMALVGAVEHFLDDAGLRRKDIAVIGLDGPMLLRQPPSQEGAPGRVLQVGDGETLAEEARIDVVGALRAADIAAGGRGAPLAPVYHLALIKALADPPEGAVGVLTIDAAATLTLAPEAARAIDLLAFDAGPAFALIDPWLHFRGVDVNVGAGDFDALAAAGAPDDAALRMMALHPFLRTPPPRFIDRYAFNADALARLPKETGAATLAAFIAESVARSERFLPELPGGYIVCGPGRNSAALMAALGARLDVEAVTAEAAGWRGDALDAEAAAFLAVRALRKLPLTYPKTTRAPTPVTGGVFHRAPL